MKHEFDRLPRLVRPWVCLLAVMGAGFLSGCVSPKPEAEVRRFSEAVATTATKAGGAFDAVQAGYLEEEISVMALQTNVTEFNPASIKPFLSPEAVQARVKVLEVLRLYAAKLSLLLGETSAKDLDQDTTKLTHALNKLDTKLVASALVKSDVVAPQDIDLFMTAVNAVENWILRRQEAEHARAVIGEMKGPVNTICRLLSKDLARVHGELRAEYEQTRQNDDRSMIENWPRLSVVERREELRNLTQLTLAVQRADSTLAALQTDVRDLAAAHEALDEVFTKNSANAAALIDDFAAQALRISSYYNSLQTSDESL